VNSHQTPTLSVVIPVYLSEQVVDELYRRLKGVLDGMAPEMAHEIVYVDDGGADRSAELLDAIAERDESVRVLHLSRNFGHQIAITAGLDHAIGDAVVVMDDDLQDPPEVIPEMVAKWREGFETVFAVRDRREGEGAIKLTAAKAFYRVLGWLSDTHIPVDAGDFRLMDRVVVDAIGGMREESRYLRGMVAWAGFRQTSVAYVRNRRFAGRTNYSLRRLVRLGMDGVTSFSAWPLALSARFGVVVMCVAFAYAAVVLYKRLVDPASILPGTTSVLIAVLFLGGVQLVSIGMLGAYTSRIYYETKRRPLYLVSRVSGAATGQRPAPDDRCQDGGTAR